MSTAHVKVFRQRCIEWSTGSKGGVVTYGGWRMWCITCRAYEWAGLNIAEAMDYARRHCARG